jgi:hypothetical protein
MSKNLKSARAKLAKGDFASMSPMELEALAKWSAGIEEAPRKSRMLPQLIEAILDITKPENREQARTDLHAYLEDRVVVSIDKVWTAEDFKQVK